MASFSNLKNEVFSRENRKRHFDEQFSGMNAFDRHKKFVNDYVRFYGSGTNTSSAVPVKTDLDVLRESFRFIRSEEDDANKSWEQRLAKRYYDKLFKEYCVADMSRYKESKIGLRWRTEKEVMTGKGQFICGTKGCDERAGLHSFEVSFAYVEAGQCKSALVKLRVCPRHATQLNYRKEKEMQRKRRKRSNERVCTKNEEEEEEEEEDDEEEEGSKEDVKEEVKADFEQAEGQHDKHGQHAHAEARTKGGTGEGNEKASGQGANIWAAEVPENDSSKDEEFDQYFQDLLF